MAEDDFEILIPRPPLPLYWNSRQSLGLVCVYMCVHIHVEAIGLASAVPLIYETVCLFGLELTGWTRLGGHKAPVSSSPLT